MEMFPGKKTEIKCRRLTETNIVQAADADRDGQVSAEEFGTMINVATAAQNR